MTARRVVWVVATLAAMVVGVHYTYAQIREYKSGVVWPEPKVVTPGPTAADPPSDAVVLLGGKETAEKWNQDRGWEFKDGYAFVKSDVTTKDAYGDCQLHVEFATPDEVKGRGQGRGNSGIYLMGKYEVQILDSFENETYFDGQCGAIYKQTPPMVNASRKPGEWQTYDIVFEAPRFNEDGALKKPGYVTVLHNGVLVQNHFELQGGTYYDRPAAYDLKGHPERLPLKIQFHGNPVKFRNIWVREIPPIVGKKPQK